MNGEAPAAVPAGLRIDAALGKALISVRTTGAERKVAREKARVGKGESRPQVSREDPNTAEGQLISGVNGRLLDEARREGELKSLRGQKDTADKNIAAIRALSRGNEQTQAEARQVLERNGVTTITQIGEQAARAVALDGDIKSKAAALKGERGANLPNRSYASFEGRHVGRIHNLRESEARSGEGILDDITGKSSRELQQMASAGTLEGFIAGLPNLSVDQRRQIQARNDVMQSVRKSRYDEVLMLHIAAAKRAGRTLSLEDMTEIKDRARNQAESGPTEHLRNARQQLRTVDSAAIREQGGQRVDVFMAQFPELTPDEAVSLRRELGIGERPSAEAGYPVTAGGRYDELLHAEDAVQKMTAECVGAATRGGVDPRNADIFGRLMVARQVARDDRARIIAQMQAIPALARILEVRQNVEAALKAQKSAAESQIRHADRMARAATLVPRTARRILEWAAGGLKKVEDDANRERATIVAQEQAKLGGTEENPGLIADVARATADVQTLQQLGVALEGFTTPPATAPAPSAS